MGTSRDSSSEFSPPIELAVRRIGALRAALVLLHSAAALPALLLELHWGIRLAWLAALLVSGWRSLRWHGVERLRLGTGGWELVLADRRLKAELVGWFAQTWLCVLRFRSAEGSHTIALAPLTEAAGHRRLRAMLRLGDGRRRK